MKVRLKMLVQWGPTPAGAVLEFEEEKAKHIIASGYAEYAPPEEKKSTREIVTPPFRSPTLEVADIAGAAEQAIISPQFGKCYPGEAEKTSDTNSEVTDED